MTGQQRTRITRILAIGIVLLASILIFLLREHVDQLARYGYPGIFLLSILANATVILPAPGILFVFALGAVLNPAMIALAAGAGAAIGELFGYLIGYSGRGVIEDVKMYSRILEWLKGHPKWKYFMIFILAFIPNPLFDLAGIAAGALKIPVAGFLIFTFLGKTFKMLMIAYAGAYSLDRLSEIFK